MGEEVKLPKSLLSIPGTRPNNSNNQLLISSGIPALDELIGGGFPVGTVILLEEDRTGSYAKVILRYFLAEGVINSHSIFIASQDTSTESIVIDLPSATSTDPEPPSKTKSNDEKMKIAFMYQNLPTSEAPVSHQLGHHYDLTTPMSQETLDKADITHWENKTDKDAPNTFSNSSYHNLLDSIKNKIKSGQFSIKDTPKRRSVLRIVLHALGSPMWRSDDPCAHSINANRDLDMFIYCLRALVRSAFAVAVVTVPAYLLEKNSLERCIYSSDIALRLQAFAGTELEKNAVLSDYHGYFEIVKSAPINSLIAKHPGKVEYTFKLRRKKFCIEKLHLPPALEDVDNNDFLAMGCGSNSKHLLEF